MNNEKPSEPFSNGTEYMMFVEYFCERCKAGKFTADGFPEIPKNGGCLILDKIMEACFDIEQFPSNDILEIRNENGEIISWHQCRKFEEKTE